MEMSMAAIMSIVALTVVVVISCVKDDLNVGILGVGFAILVGGIWANLSGAKVMAAFPVGLFMILVGVTFMFGMAQANGTMEKLTAYSVRLCKGNTAIVPLIVYLITTFVSTIGPGNIAGCALMAPVAMAIAARVGLPAFLMTLVVVGAANGASFSPFAPAGIISNGIIAKMAPQLGITNDLNLLAWKIHLNSEISQTFVNAGGFFLMGGWAWIQKQRGAKLDIDELAPKPEPFDKHQLITLAMIAMLIVLVVLPGLPITKGLFNKSALNLFSNVGSVAFLLSCIMMLTGSGDSKAAVKQMPWTVILMVCGVSVLIEVMDKAGGLNVLVKMMGAVSNPVTVNGTLGLITGIISAYSSSSGVVVPMFLPMVPGLIQEVGGGNPIALISSINVGSHLVDTSPLSTLGALCIACADEKEDKSALFRKLLIWGLSMAIVSGIICWLFFGVLNL